MQSQMSSTCRNNVMSVKINFLCDDGISEYFLDAARNRYVVIFSLIVPSMFRFFTWILLRPIICIFLLINFVLCSSFCVTYNHTLSPSLSQSSSWDNSIYFTALDLQWILSLFILEMFPFNRILLYMNLSPDIFFFKCYVTFYLSISVSWFFLLYYLE
jgi:hypothetical protein